jgi:hypothetical protein
MIQHACRMGGYIRFNADLLAEQIEQVFWPSLQ